MTGILSIGYATPLWQYNQALLGEYLSDFFEFETSEKKLFKKLFEKSGITYKYSILPDFKKNQQAILFKNGDPWPDIEERMHFFRKYASSIALDAVQNCFKNNYHESKKSITHIITTTCTGLYAPGMEIEIPEKLGLNYLVKRYAINFLGCHAAFKAFDLADKICKAEKNAKVLIVSTELSSIHFQPVNTRDNWLASALFGDGAAAALVSNNENEKPSIFIKNFYSILNRQGRDNMTWNITSKNFLMGLSSHIPELIMDYAENLIDATLDQVKVSQIDYWCFHPGGIRILDKMREKLNISHDSMAASYKVLNDFGNMSSPTILFILKKMLDDQLDKKKNAGIFAAGFGPGLSLEGMLLEYHKT